MTACRHVGDRRRRRGASCSPGALAGGTATSRSRIVGETGYNFIEAIGRLSWLDVPLPAASVALDVRRDRSARRGIVGGGLRGGGLGGGAADHRSRSIVAVRAVQGSTTGTYWQGRYSLPLLVGVPLLLGLARVPAVVASRVACVCRRQSPSSYSTLRRGQSARRWGVGTDGSMMPWDWDTIHSPLPPIVVLTALAALSGGLAATLWRIAAPSGLGHGSFNRT